MIVISPLEQRDRPDWDRLWAGYLAFYETVLDEGTTDRTFARLTGPGAEVHGAIARDDGRVVGFVHWLPHASTWALTDVCYLEDLFVDPDARAQGVGRALVGHVRSWAEEHGAASVHWLTAESNSTARGLYDRIGQRTGLIQYEIPLGG